MKQLFVTTALATVLAAGPAFSAQKNAPDQEASPDATQKQMMKESKSATDQAGSTNAGSIEFISAQKESDWLATSLIGRAVQNAKGETLGDINEVVLDQNGEAVAVLISVGGFLGLGGKDVAVNYGSLEFRKREIKQPAASRDMRESAYQRSNKPRGVGGGKGNPLLDPQKQRADITPRKDADHSDMIVVLNATKEQLDSAPTFRRIGEAETSDQGEKQPAEKEDKIKQEKPAQ